MRRWIGIIFCCLSYCLLAGCGFHLRGDTPVPSALSELYFQPNNAYSSFTKDIQRLFPEAGVNLVATRQQAPYTLLIVSDVFNSQLISISPTSQVSQFNLTYTVTYQLENNHTGVKLPAQSVVAIRTFTQNPNQMLGSTDNEGFLQTAMRREVVYSLLDRLMAPATVRALSASTTVPHEATP